MSYRNRVAAALAAAALLALLGWGIWTLVDDGDDDPPDDSHQATEQRAPDDGETQVPGIIEDPDGPTPSTTPPPPPPDQDGGENPASQVQWIGGTSRVDFFTAL